MDRTRLCMMLAVALTLALTLALLAGCDYNKKSKPQAAKAAPQEGGLTPRNEFEATADPPFTAETRFAAGQLAEVQSDQQRAIKQYTEALKLDPQHKNALFRLATVYTQVKMFPEAVATWQKYIKVTNGAPAGYNNLGFCYELAGKADDAEAAYRAGIERDPDDSACRINYGLMLARRGRVDDAIAQLRTVLTPAEVHYNLGSVCEQQGHKEEAKAYYRKALELDPKLRDAKVRLEALQ